MPSPPRTVLDGLEGLWEGAAAGWRETNRRRDEAEAAATRERRRLAQSASRGLEQATGGLKEGRRRAGLVAEAVVGNRGYSREPQAGPVSRTTVDQRMATAKDTIAQNAARASKSGPVSAMGWPGAFGEWVGKVGPGGEWDDRKRLGDIYERQGNFSYGATAAALGLPKHIAQAGAGFVQRGRNVYRAAMGEPLAASVGHLRWPYGDDPRDQLSIADGYEYGLSRMRRDR